MVTGLHVWRESYKMLSWTVWGELKLSWILFMSIFTNKTVTIISRSRRALALLKLSRRAFYSSPDIFHTWRPDYEVARVPEANVLRIARLRSRWKLSLLALCLTLGTLSALSGVWRRRRLELTGRRDTEGIIIIKYSTNTHWIGYSRVDYTYLDTNIS